MSGVQEAVERLKRQAARSLFVSRTAEAMRLNSHMAKCADGLEAMAQELADAEADLAASEQARERAEAERDAAFGVVDAARAYYASWCQDEADHPEITGCELLQHQQAAALRDALARRAVARTADEAAARRAHAGVWRDA